MQQPENPILIVDDEEQALRVAAGRANRMDQQLQEMMAAFAPDKDLAE
jgi:hypothetical protein